MDVELSWQTFACTGDILCYLDYRRQLAQQRLTAPAGEKQMDTIVTPGLVLKETRYKESDRIITLLTPGLGVISASAQSSLRLKSKLFSACGLFCYSEFVLVPGRNMYTVREADVKNVFHGISSSIEGMSLAMYMAEMASALSPTGDEAAKN